MSYPSYLESYRNGSLQKMVGLLTQRLQHCDLCPRRCGADRLHGKKGFCKTGAMAKVYSFSLHHGEEPPVSGTRGSGTIFFSGCTMGCVYCQNFKFSQQEAGSEVSAGQLAQCMMELQRQGCHNINLVTPTHVLPQILAALCVAVPQGLRIPLVYNTGGYELSATIALLKGVVDIYLPDMRYIDAAMGMRYSAAPGYPSYNQAAVRQMHAQAGLPEFDEEGMIKKGVIIRHLVLPGNISGTDGVLRFLAKEISCDAYVSLMSQYLPCYQAQGIPEIARRISREEYDAAQGAMRRFGLHNGWTQEGHGLEALAGIHMEPHHTRGGGAC